MYNFPGLALAYITRGQFIRTCQRIGTFVMHCLCSTYDGFVSVKYAMALLRSAFNRKSRQALAFGQQDQQQQKHQQQMHHNKTARYIIEFTTELTRGDICLYTIMAYCFWQLLFVRNVCVRVVCVRVCDVD